ncbi:MAG: RNA methyltransferase, partial [Bacteroidales bacterium]|nr:RNA methyltransferase [Bacteroidales bacterium]
KQSLKGAIPKVNEPQSVRDFILSVPEGAVKMICYCFEGDKHSIPELLSSSGAPGAPGRDSGLPDIYILIGPEGDFSPAEAELALSRGWMSVSLGSSRLRTETAALVAVTQVYTCLGE